MSMTEFLLALYKSITVLKLCSFSDFNVNEYDRLNKCENGVDMTWIVPSKFGKYNSLLPIHMQNAIIQINCWLSWDPLMSRPEMFCRIFRFSPITSKQTTFKLWYVATTQITMQKCKCENNLGKLIVDTLRKFKLTSSHHNRIILESI